MTSRFLNIAFYRFVSLDSLPELRVQFKKFLTDREIRGSVLLSTEGINGFLAASESAIREFQTEMNQYPQFANMTYKESWSEELPFQRTKVKLKKEIISMGMPDSIIPAIKTGSRIQPTDLKSWLDQGKEVVLVDTRNDYEIEHGTFVGAQTLGMSHFRQFPEKLTQAKDQLSASGAPVVMFCTGGIRCEKATALALDLGLPHVYQLEGGILKYFEDCGSAHYQGSCFVFDEREALNSSLAATSKK